MSAVSEILVREYFELHGFYVHQQRKYVAPGQRDQEENDFVILHPHPRLGEGPPPFELTSADLDRVGRAVVAVKGWHTDTFTPAFLTATPDIGRFADAAAIETVVRGLGNGGTLLKILVVSALPQTKELRARSIELLQAKGINGVISFPTILGYLITHIEANRNYQKSDVLQVIRILKNYDFLKDRQLELFKSKRERPEKPKPKVAAKPSEPG